MLKSKKLYHSNEAEGNCRTAIPNEIYYILRNRISMFCPTISHIKSFNFYILILEDYIVVDINFNNCLNFLL